jgi:hypothetical protein
MIETKIYVGLNDADTKQQKFETEKYVSIMKYVCKSYHVPFSFILNQGGYFHENGYFTQEPTLVLTLIDANSSMVRDIAKDLCAFFNQESVMVTEMPVKAYYVKEKI